MKTIFVKVEESSFGELYNLKFFTNLLAYEQVAESYAEVTKIHAQQEQVHIKMAVKCHRLNGGTVADIGCGCGRDVNFWNSLGFDYYGLDASAAMIEIAKRNNPEASFTIGDMRRYTINKDSTDLLWYSSSLQHIPRKEIVHVLKLGLKGLKKNGIVYANYRPPKEGIDKETFVYSDEYANGNGEKVKINRFIAHYSSEEMNEIFESVGLQILNSVDYDEIYHEYNIEKADYIPKRNVILARKV